MPIIIVAQVMQDNEGAIALYRGLSPACRFDSSCLHVELKVCAAGMFRRLRPGEDVLRLRAMPHLIAG